MKRRFTFFLLLFCISLTLQAQTTITGVVIDDLGQDVIGANVFIKGSYDGTSTEADGTFNFETFEEGDHVLSITYIGFKDYENAVHLNGDTIDVNVKLQPTAANLKEIIITAGAFEASDEKKGVVLSSLDIVTTAGAAADIAGALNTLPGTQRVGETGQLFVRGGAASETRTFIDGMRVQNPFTNTVPDVPSRGRFSPFLFKGTIFSTGGYSAEYGQALSSALILNSTDLATQTSSSISLMTIGGGLSHTHAWDNASLSVSGNYINLGPYINLVPQERDWQKPFQGGDGQAIFRYKTSETGLFKLHTNYSASSLEFQYADLINIGQTNSLALNSGNLYVNSTFREALGDKWSMMAGVSYSKDDREVDELFYVNSEDQTAQGKMTLTNYLSDNVNIKFGAEYLYNVFNEQFTNRDKSNFNSKLTEKYTAGFIESDIYFSRRIAAKVGARIEHSVLIDQWNLAPRFSLAYRTGPGSQVSLAYGQFYQTPVNDLLKFNSNLEFERASHYIINFQQIKNDRIFRVEGYYKTYDDLIKHPVNRQWESRNAGDGYARGIDVFFRDRKTIKYGDYWISYSYLDTERDYLDFPEAAPPYFASAHNSSVVYKHWFNKITTALGVTYSFASGRPYNDPNLVAFNSERTKVFQDLSVNASYLTNIKDQFTVIFASISNVPGFDNTFGYRFAPTPGSDGKYPSYAVKPDAKRFFFIGMFVSIGQTFKPEEQVKPD
jgi:outer membrane cobalamin receptor